MTDLENAHVHSPCCKDAGMKKLEHDDLEVEIDDIPSHIPVYTCKECGKKWAIERVFKKGEDE